MTQVAMTLSVIIILISISLISSDPEHLFMLTYISVVKALLKFFASLSVGCLFAWHSSSFIFWIQVLCQICFANIFHSVA